jgi:hypothetical protein
MVKYSLITLVFQVAAICNSSWRCSCHKIDFGPKSRSFVDVLAKYQADNNIDYQKDSDKLLSVILSTDEDYNNRQNSQQQYAGKYQGGQAGNYQQQPQQLNPLLKQASTASIYVLFILLIWRSLAAYELADQFNSGSLRIVAVAPTVLILCANLTGFVINVMKPYNFKNFLKFILALNITREFVELLYNIVMLVVNPSNTGISRDVYFGRFFMNVWWLSLCVTFSKSRWVLQITPPSASNQDSSSQGQRPYRNYQPPQDNGQKYY